MNTLNNNKMRVAIAMLFCILSVSIEAYTTSKDLRQFSRNKRQQKIWMPPSQQSNPPSPELITQNMLKTTGSTETEKRRGSRTGWTLSQAAVNSMDTTFSPRSSSSSTSSSTLAHGILSPETVSRMDQITHGGHGNEAVRLFLQRYRRKGPMSCLEMLSDPEVLPHLTQAMRDIV